MSDAPVHLRLDFCDHAAAKYAVERWYYRTEMPRGKLVRVGVWEEGAFVGVVIFGMGSSADLGTPWGLTCFECCEMVRVAIGPHRSPTSRIIAIAIKLLKRQSPGIKAVVSFSDPAAGHVGTVYQAMNWIYTGETAPDKRYVAKDGTEYHSRAVSATGIKFRKGKGTRCPKPKDCTFIKVPGKLRYVYPLDGSVRPKLEARRTPYLKKSSERNARAGSDTLDTPSYQLGEGGSLPTPALIAVPPVPPTPQTTRSA